MKNYYFEKEELHQAIMSVIDENRTVNCSTVYFYDDEIFTKLGLDADDICSEYYPSIYNCDDDTIESPDGYLYSLDDFIDNLEQYIISCGNGGAFDD